MTQEWPSYPGAQPSRSGFSADPATSPGLRASNADRAHAVAALDQALAEGRLTEDEHDQRKGAAEAAITLGDLGPLVADVDLPTVAEATSARLPVPFDDPDPVRPEPVSGEVETGGRRRRRDLLGIPPWWFQMTGILLLIWVMSGANGGGWGFWPAWPIVSTLIFLLFRMIGRRRG